MGNVFELRDAVVKTATFEHGFERERSESDCSMEIAPWSAGVLQNEEARS